LYLGVFIRFDSLLELLSSLNLDNTPSITPSPSQLLSLVYFDSLYGTTSTEGLQAKMKLAKVSYNWIGNS
jgi:hypothetical protein